MRIRFSKYISKRHREMLKNFKLDDRRNLVIAIFDPMWNTRSTYLRGRGIIKCIGTMKVTQRLRFCLGCGQSISVTRARMFTEDQEIVDEAKRTGCFLCCDCYENLKRGKMILRSNYMEIFDAKESNLRIKC